MDSQVTVTFCKAHRRMVTDLAASHKDASKSFDDDLSIVSLSSNTTNLKKMHLLPWGQFRIMYIVPCSM